MLGWWIIICHSKYEDESLTPIIQDTNVKYFSFYSMLSLSYYTFFPKISLIPKHMNFCMTYLIYISVLMLMYPICCSLWFKKAQNNCSQFLFLEVCAQGKILYLMLDFVSILEIILQISITERNKRHRITKKINE